MVVDAFYVYMYSIFYLVFRSPLTTSTLSRSRASSTLHPRKQHAPAHVLTKDPATGWTSDGNGTTGSNTVDEEIPWLHLEWTQAVSIHEIRLQFQAGFGAGTCEILWDHDNDDDNGLLWEELEDVHSVQIHTFKEPRDNVTSIRLNFRDCTDFYQRLTLYRLELWGTTTI